MANLLADPSLWKSWQGMFWGGYVGPPAEYWDARTCAYFMYPDASAGGVLEMQLVTAPAPGDVVAGEYEPLTGNPGGAVPVLEMHTNGSTATLKTVTFPKPFGSAPYFIKASVTVVRTTNTSLVAESVSGASTTAATFNFVTADSKEKNSDVLTSPIPFQWLAFGKVQS